jgi:transketolase
MVDKKIESMLRHYAYNLRVSSLRATTQAGSGHPTSCLSAADCMAALFFYAMCFDPQNVHNPDNDQFILSKGHAAPLLYAVWKELGVITDEELIRLRTFNSVLEGHPTPRFSHVQAATGSLGQGLSIGLGQALSAKLDKRSFKTYVLLGDMETTEGSVWEAAEVAAYYNTDNLIALVDCNGLGQSTEPLDDHDVARYAKKFEAFGWHTICFDGHDMSAIMQALNQAKASRGKPIVLLAKTIKGYGLEHVQGKQGFHGKAFSHQELPMLLEHLQKRFSADLQEQTISFKPCVLTPTTVKKETIVSAHQQPVYALGQMVATRRAYGDALVVQGAVHSNSVVLDAEVKNSTYAELFEKEYPDRFFQCFIAEQNMVSMGVGFAIQKKIPFISTFGAFFSRAYDQIRMAAIGRSPLRLCGSHAGVSIGEDGPSQMGLEDIAMMSAIPDSVILYPCDAASTVKLVEKMSMRSDGITYLRTTRAATPVIYEGSQEFTIGGCAILRQSTSDKACIVAAGITVFEALKAYEILYHENIIVSVLDAYSIKPLAVETITALANRSSNNVVTVEDHYLEGGLGQAVSYALRNETITINCLAVTKLPRSGKPEELLAYQEIDAAAIVAAVKKLVNL